MLIQMGADFINPRYVVRVASEGGTTIVVFFDGTIVTTALTVAEVMSLLRGWELDSNTRSV